ncbi:MAG: hypothetical protein KME05_20365 [Gloeocapsa sp. UFS-A4-WI-NPMV-4B04]|jgi:hypothetical protein|nr:hypothetical protein [Gloeocapsa sp. UFS-A4-WI-NPMV-4B04]
MELPTRPKVVGGSQGVQPRGDPVLARTQTVRTDRERQLFLVGLIHACAE